MRPPTQTTPSPEVYVTYPENFGTTALALFMLLVFFLGLWWELRKALKDDPPEDQG